MTMDLAAIIGLGTVAATFFWRLNNHMYQKICHVEEKVDHIAENMTTKAECAAQRQAYQEMFNGHDHTPDGDLVVIRRKQHGQVQQDSEEVLRGRYLRLPKAT